MKNYITIISTLFILASCDKPVVHPDPTMNYIDLENKEVKFSESASVDINKDGMADVRFSTKFLGDPIAKKDMHIYLATSRSNCRLPVNANENPPVLSKGEPIPLENFAGYTWYENTQIQLVQKVTEITGDPYWEGLWKSGNHQYLPVQVMANKQRFNGWMELSFDTNGEKIILHKAAISKLPETFVIAGV
ncbi:MAG: hypothetical protein ACTHK0_01180 [Ginsengibacter sp.]